MFYEIGDFFYTSAYEGKRDNYNKKIKYLESYKKDLDRSIAECDEAMANFNQIYEEDNKLYGEAVELFFERSMELKAKIDNYRESLKNVSNEVTGKINQSKELYDYYVQKCEEDKELKKKWEEEHK